MIILENDRFKAEFSAKGAELQQLNDKVTGLDYLWNGDPKFWAKHSPVLFPIVGGLKENSYIYEGETFSLSRHGFARDMEFDLTDERNNELIFTLRQSEETWKVYPFEFELKLRYILKGNGLTCTYHVKNPGKKDLLFAIGGHPAFAVPLAEGDSYEDYYLLFDRDDELNFHVINANLISDQQVSLELKGRKLRLNHELFKHDALVFKTLQSEKITLKNTNNLHGFEFTFYGFPFFGIWAAPGADFVCLEPWCGIADGINHNRQFQEKEGMQCLPPGKEWERSWSISPF